MSKKAHIIYAFIDSQNLNLGVKSQGWQLDFSRFRIYLKDKYKVSKAFLFIGYIPKHQKLYKYLKRSGYILIFKPVLESNHRKLKPKGNVDAELVLHTMIEFPNYDSAVIVSGDGDFYCLVDYLKIKRKLEKLIVPNKRYSSLLKVFAAYIVNISLLRSKLEKIK
ncbi:NYN domain-containing protein [Candidatus Woesebacteria bacterium]|nr:NYN domain-containing protein [Candidatus Woesebacteria bacterium]